MSSSSNLVNFTKFELELTTLSFTDKVVSGRLLARVWRGSQQDGKEESKERKNKRETVVSDVGGISVTTVSYRLRGLLVQTTVRYINRNLHKTRNVFVLYYFAVQELLQTLSHNFAAPNVRAIETGTPSREKWAPMERTIENTS